MSAIRKWSAKDGDLSLTSLQKMYPKDYFYIARHVYPAGAFVQGVIRSSVMYLIRGKCSIKFSEEEYYSEGDVVDIDGGTYEICVSKESDLEIAFVCDLRNLHELKEAFNLH
jgi:hypothetical protein